MKVLELDGRKIIQLARDLRQRIEERFPESGLSEVALRLVSTCEKAQPVHDSLQKPNLGLRIASGFCIIGLISILITVMQNLSFSFKIASFPAFIQSFQPTLEMFVFLGAVVIFFTSLEARWKSSRGLLYLQELRAMAHLIDMHQLEKDPARFRSDFTKTKSSPKMDLSPTEMLRYLDYCSEMLAVTGKLGNLCAQGFPDSRLLAGVDALETMTTGLSRKIWQKIMIIESSTSKMA